MTPNKTSLCAAWILLVLLVLFGCGPNGPPGAWQGHNFSHPYRPFMIDVKNTTTDNQSVVVTTWNNNLRPISAKIAAGDVLRVIVTEPPEGFSIYSTTWTGRRFGGFKTWDHTQFDDWLTLTVSIPDGTLTGEIRR